MKSKDFISQQYHDYKIYVNMNRATASIYDGLKPVTRRILYSAYQTCKDKYIKSATLVGHVIGRYHPHSLASLYDTVVNMVNMGYFIGKGNFGYALGLTKAPPAAMRYTELRLNPVVEMLAFNRIKQVEFVESEIPGYKEPKNLPVMLPLSLVTLKPYPTYNMGIGVGLRGVYPLIYIKDLIQLVIDIIDEKPIPDTIRGIYQDVEYDVPLKESKFTVEFKSKYERISDTQIIVTALAPKVSDSLDTKLSDIAYVKDESSDTTRVVINLKRGKRIDDKKLDLLLGSKETFIVNVFDDDTQVIKDTTVLDWVLHTLKRYIVYTKSYVQEKLDQTVQRLTQIELIIKHISTIRKYMSGDILVLPDEIKFVEQYTIHNMNRMLQPETKQKLLALRKQYEDQLKDIKSVVKSDYELLYDLIKD